jgi:hypothetical protein
VCLYWLITLQLKQVIGIEMHNGDSRAELSYIDEKEISGIWGKWICSENDPECKKSYIPY